MDVDASEALCRLQRSLAAQGILDVSSWRDHRRRGVDTWRLPGWWKLVRSGRLEQIARRLDRNHLHQPAPCAELLDLCRHTDELA